MTGKWVLVRYESPLSLVPIEKELSPYAVLEVGREGRTKILVFDVPLEAEHIEGLRIKIKAFSGGVVIYPIKYHQLISEILTEVFGRRVLPIEETREDWTSAQEVFYTEFLGSVMSPPIRESITLQGFSVAEEGDISALKEEEPMPMEQIIRRFWDRDPALKRILLYAYLLHYQRALGTSSLFNDLKRRAGLKPSEFSPHISMFEYQEVMERGGNCFLRTDNGAYQAVERLVKQEYEIDQVINDMTGAEFLSTAFDGRRAQAKRFSNTVKNVLLNRLPHLRCIDMSSNPDVFELFLPGKWFAVFLCQTSSSPLGIQPVATALLYKEELNRWLVMKSNFAVVCGPAFWEPSRLRAEANNVFLLEAAGFLKLNKFLSSLGEEERITVHDYFPLLFSLGAGVIPVEKALSIVLKAMQEG